MDEKRCSVMVSGNDRYGIFHPHSCGNKAVIKRDDGKWYCSIHDPETIKRKDKEHSKKWREKFDLEEASSIAQSACLEINPDNPRAVAESIGDMYEACVGVIKWCERELDSFYPPEITAIVKALAKAEGGKGEGK